MGVEERQLVGVVRIDEHRQHLAAEQARQHVDVLQHPRSGRCLSAQNGSLISGTNAAGAVIDGG
jgi:hypothetical protein